MATTIQPSPDAIPTMYGEGQRQYIYQSDKNARDGEERCVQQEEDVRLPTKDSSSISTIQECMKVNLSRYRYKEMIPEVKTVDSKDNERDVNDLLQGKSRCQIDGSAIRDCGLQ